MNMKRSLCHWLFLWIPCLGYRIDSYIFESMLLFEAQKGQSLAPPQQTHNWRFCCTTHFYTYIYVNISGLNIIPMKWRCYFSHSNHSDQIKWIQTIACEMVWKKAFYKRTTFMQDKYYQFVDDIFLETKTCQRMSEWYTVVDVFSYSSVGNDKQW